MEKLLVFAVVLLNCCFENTTGNRVPTWWMNQPSIVEWTMTDLTNNYTMKVKQSCSARENKLRWDIDDGNSYVIWSLREQRMFYVFPARVDGQDMTLMSLVTYPFTMDTTQKLRFLTIIYPDMTGYTLENRNPPYFEWVREQRDPYYKSTVMLKENGEMEPIIIETMYKNENGLVVTKFRNHRYEEPDASVWSLPQGRPWRSVIGTQKRELLEEMLVETYLKGQGTIWPIDIPFRSRGYTQIAFSGQEQVLERKGMQEHSTPFPYSQKYYDSYRYPRVLNWNSCGAVTAVKSQDICSACGAFAAVGVLESAYFINRGKLMNMSEQAVIDCSWSGRGQRERVNSGCYSGFPDVAFEWVANNNGIPTTKEYGGFKRTNDRCKLDGNDRFNPVASITSYTKVPRSVNAMKMALLRHGPVAVGLTSDELGPYTTGIISTPAKEGAVMRHAGLVVGYNVTENGVPYWIVKNSWGKNWGLNGFFFVLSNDSIDPMLLLRDAYYVNMRKDGSSRTYCDICGS